MEPRLPMSLLTLRQLREENQALKQELQRIKSGSPSFSHINASGSTVLNVPSSRTVADLFNKLKEKILESPCKSDSEIQNTIAVMDKFINKQSGGKTRKYRSRKNKKTRKY